MDLSLGIQKRKHLLLYALYLEGFLSEFLAALLGIKNTESSMSFGNTSKALSFNQKVNLLIDLGALKKEDQNKFITFMELRNQFMHNIHAKTYELCYEYLPKGKDNFVLGRYPQKANLSREKQLEEASLDLASEIIKLTIGVIKKINTKISKEVTADLYKEQFDSLVKSIYEATEQLDTIADELDKSSTLIEGKMKGVGKVARKLILDKHLKSSSKGSKSN